MQIIKREQIAEQEMPPAPPGHYPFRFELPSGVYFFHIETNFGFVVKKSAVIGS
jgi:hypothetical protein